jgi:hypothetical protein
MNTFQVMTNESNYLIIRVESEDFVPLKQWMPFIDFGSNFNKDYFIFIVMWFRFSVMFLFLLLLL